MGIIRSLSKDVVEKIAAGEVVERPASVVKELVENSIDSGAGAISVEIEGGGAGAIRVTDDGCGMDADDLAMCVDRHSTSKIRDAADLWRVPTMGFRGEALASIGAVSKLTIETKPGRVDAVEGARIDVLGGAVEGPAPAGCAPGTRVAVRDLFYNVPARRKFLKSDRVEAARCVEAAEDLALAFPRVRFEIVVDGSRRLALPAAGGDGGSDRVRAIVGQDDLVPVGERGADISISGFVSERGRSAGRDVHVFVNQRPVRDRMIMHAIAQAFGERLDVGRSPSAVLWIDIDPSRVDVNVHPAKREVKFADSGAVHSFVMSSVRKALGTTAQVVAEGVEGAIMRFEERRAEGRAPRPAAPRATLGPAAGAHAPRLPGMEGVVMGMRPLGQFGGAFIACEGPDEALTIIDKHAAHERIGFDRLSEQHAEGSVARQRLLIPEQIELRAADAAALLERANLLAESGFEVEPFGGGTIMVKAVPSVLGDASVASLMEGLAQELGDLGAQVSIDDALRRVFARVACHRQVRAGDELSPEEVMALVREVEEKEVKTCPHGRPAVVRIGKEEMEKWFRRS